MVFFRFVNLKTCPEYSKEKEDDMSSKEIEMTVAGVALDPQSNYLPWIVLTEKKVCPTKQEGRVLQICTKDMSAVKFMVDAMKETQGESVRFGPYGLIKTITKTLGGEVEKVVIDNFVANPEVGDYPYYEAKIVVKKPAGRFIKKETFVKLGSRPSDAIALAIECKCPIYVTENVFDGVERFLNEKMQSQEKNPGLEINSNIDLQKVPDDVFGKC